QPTAATPSERVSSFGLALRPPFDPGSRSQKEGRIGGRGRRAVISAAFAFGSRPNPSSLPIALGLRNPRELALPSWPAPVFNLRSAANASSPVGNCCDQTRVTG